MFAGWYVKIKSLVFSVSHQEQQAQDLPFVRSLPVLENRVTVTRLASTDENRYKGIDLTDPLRTYPWSCTLSAKLIEFSGLFPEWANMTNPVINYVERITFQNVIVTCPGIGPPSSDYRSLEVVPDLDRLDLTRDLKDQQTQTMISMPMP